MSYSAHPVFFFNDTATTEIYTLSLHDALPIWLRNELCLFPHDHRRADRSGVVKRLSHSLGQTNATMRSEEHTSELQSQSNLVCRLLLEKKNTNNIHPVNIQQTCLIMLCAAFTV